MEPTLSELVQAYWRAALLEQHTRRIHDQLTKRRTMLRSRAEVKQIAAAILNGFLADAIFEFPKIAAAVDKCKSEWPEFLDEQTARIEQILMSKFNTSD